MYSDETLDMFDNVERLRAMARRDIDRCECCGGRTKVYRRKLNSGMAATLCWMATHEAGEWKHLAREAGRYVLRNRDYSKLTHWRMVEERPNLNDPSKRTSGFWRITDRGWEFAANQTREPSHIFVQSPGERFLGFEETSTDVIEALGDHFDYTELMYGE